MLASMSVPIATIGSPEVGGAELAHRDRIGGVRLDNMRQRARELLHRFRIGVDAEHLAAEHHRARSRGRRRTVRARRRGTPPL